MECAPTGTRKIAEKDRRRLGALGIVGLVWGQPRHCAGRVERALKLADFDVIELSNMNRIRCAVHTRIAGR